MAKPHVDNDNKKSSSKKRKVRDSSSSSSSSSSDYSTSSNSSSSTSSSDSSSSGSSSSSRSLPSKKSRYSPTKRKSKEQREKEPNKPKENNNHKVEINNVTRQKSLGRETPKEYNTGKRSRSHSHFQTKNGCECCKRSFCSPSQHSAKIFVKYLTRSVNKYHIKEIFGSYGKIKYVDFPRNRLFPHTGRGYAYVEYEHSESAEDALKHMDQGLIDGQYVTVSLVPLPSRYKAPIPHRHRSRYRRTPPRRRYSRSLPRWSRDKTHSSRNVRR